MDNTTIYTEDTLNTPEFIQLILNDISPKNYTMIGLYILLFLTALIANVVVILVVFKDKYMRSFTNYFIANLSIADLLVTLVCMPCAARNAYTAVYYFGQYMCKLSLYLQYVSVASSIFTITAMAIERYLAIMRPFSTVKGCLNKTTTVMVIISIWIISLILFSPILWVSSIMVLEIPISNTSISVTYCGEDFSNFVIPQHIMGIVWFIFMFVVPGVILLFAYSMMGRTLCSGMPPIDNNESNYTQQMNKVVRGRKRAACILLLLIFVFTACWLPYSITQLMWNTESLALSETIYQFLIFLGHANSALNPIIYCTLSNKFRNSIKNLLFCTKVPCIRR